MDRMHDRRTKPRMLCADLVEVIYQDAEGQEQQTTANLDDISTNGVCLVAEEGVPVGTRVEIRHDRGQFVGEIRYCKLREPEGYFLGIEFAEDSHWTTRQFRPMHLLDPRRLATKVS